MTESERIAEMRQLLDSAQRALDAVQKQLFQLSGAPEDAQGDTQRLFQKARSLSVVDEGRVIEGVFDGQNMIGPDSKQYPVPANYASKSKLVEGDILKLSITGDGSFVYKQIGPIDRKKIMGRIVKEGKEWRVLAEGKLYRVLLASITYYKANEGDELVLILPRNREATWAAIENIIKTAANPLLEDESFAGSQDQFADKSIESVPSTEAGGSEGIDVEPTKKKTEDEDEFSLTF